MMTSNPYASKVFDKLAQLKQWQSEQHERLIREQEKQRQTLAEEQQKRLESYAIEDYFGVSTKVQSDAMATNTERGQGDTATRNDDDDLHGVCRMSATDTDEETQSIGDGTAACGDSSGSLTERDDCSRISDSEDETRKKTLMTEKAGGDTSRKPQRKFNFLKRGEGLSRFRMSADDILKQRQRLLASRAKKSSNNKPEINVKIAANNKQTTKIPAQVVEKAAPVKPMQTQTMNKQLPPRQPLSRQDSKPVLQTEVKPACKPKQASSVIVNNGKMLVPRAPALPTLQLQASKQPVTSTVAPRMPAPPSLQSTASAKPTSTSTQLGGPSWASMLSQPFLSQPVVSQPFVLQPVCQIPFTKPIITQPISQPIPPQPMLAKHMLSPPIRNLFPDNTSNPADSSRKLEQRELRMFEHLEQIAADSSFCSSSSVVTKFVERGYISSSVQSTPSKHPHDNEDYSNPLSSTPFSNPTIQNAKQLLEKFAIYKFGNMSKNCDAPQASAGNPITLNLRPLEASQDSSEESSSESSSESQLPQAGPSSQQQPGPASQHPPGPASQHVRFQEKPEVHEVESEAWSESEEDSDSSLDSSSGSETACAAITKETTSQRSENKQATASSDEETKLREKSIDEKMVLGSLVHSRLEQLQREIESVLAQQAALAAQKEELTQERQRLADAVIKKENEQTQLEKERKNLAAVTRRRQSEGRAEIEQLKQQLSDLQGVWREKEARWAAAQASQRSQMRQLSLENKQLAFQIKQLKSAQAQAKKVHFAPVLAKKPAAKQNNKQISEKNVNRRSTLPSRKIAEERNHFRTRSASPSVSEVPHITSDQRSWSPETFRTRSASPSVNVASLVTSDDPWFPKTRSNLPSNPGVKSNYVSGGDDIKISCMDDIDAVTAKYKELCFPGPSPASSLLLNTPRGIKEAYTAIFNENTHVDSNPGEPSTKLASDYIQRGVNEASTAVISENTRFNPNAEQLPTKQTSDYTQRGVNEAYTAVINENTRFNPNAEPTKEARPAERVNAAEQEYNDMVTRKSQPVATPSQFADANVDVCAEMDRTQRDKSNSEPCRTVVNEDGSKQLWFPSGNTIKVSADGTIRKVVFYNGDIQETLAREGIVRYFYAESKAWHETFSDGTQIIMFADGQREVIRPNGLKEVTFPDQSELRELEDGRQEARTKDGTQLLIEKDGTSVLLMPNGLREVRTKESTRLEYPDGTVRTMYPSGLLETKYTNGRVRIKDSSGKLILDTHCPVTDQ